ncbi:unnamed protein product [Linum tenue]|uniref:Biotin carboxyl carrier protein n=1 Tax=Linum tenue TaxID=586396 RepID=A0AAV0MCA6_9ROSI|nr:unnamed protein product [Linum tenue]
MESSVFLRSFHCSVPTVSNAQPLAERPGAISSVQTFGFSRTLVCSPVKRNLSIVSCAKTSDSSVASKSAADGSVPAASENNGVPHRATFPSGFEALMLEVCDETEVAELKLKVGDFEMHLKRNIGVTHAPLSNISPTVPPPIPSKPMDVAAPAAPPAPTPPPKKSNPFTNVSFGKSPRLAALEASGASGFVLVASPTVGTFRKNRTVKGKKQPQICKEGNMIKEGQVIGYLDQFGTELPVKTDVAGEVLKILFNDGEIVVVTSKTILLDTRTLLSLCYHHFPASRSKTHPAMLQ